MAIGSTIIIWVVVVIFSILFFGYFISLFNSLVRLKNNIKKAWANIDVLLKQRHDELPNLISTVKGYMKHEKSVLENVTKARASFDSAHNLDEKAQASNQITGALKSLFAVSENYPDLKANQNFIKLQKRITGLENEIADRREFYNDSVNTYNIKIQSFPDFIFAGMLGYKEEELFKVNTLDRKEIEVSF